MAEDQVPFGEAVRAWSYVGLNSFGGPAGQIAVMHREIVERRKWVDESRFLEALNYCMLLPGPEAQQLATYTGWLLNGTRGGLAAGLPFILPGVVVRLVLLILAPSFQDTPPGALAPRLFRSGTRRSRTPPRPPRSSTESSRPSWPSSPTPCCDWRAG